MKKCILSNLKPERVFHYFEEICGIPHGTHHTEALQQYCLEFAKEHGLEYYHDSYGNVMIFKNATKGYEDHPTVILQGHLDMVCEQTTDCELNLLEEPIILRTDGEKLWAEGTTLGGDDGIGIAYILSVLADNSLMHPAIEALFTIDEEEGLTGAHHLDASRLNGACMINIDSEEEGILTVSCAGAARISAEFRFQMCEATEEESFVELSVGGLLSGHSGSDIHLGRKSAGLVIGELLSILLEELDVSLASFTCGGRPNVICANGSAVIGCKSEELGIVMQKIRSFEAMMKQECQLREPDIFVKGKVLESIKSESLRQMLSVEDTKRVTFLLNQLPYGVFAMNATNKELVESSANIGSIIYKEGCLELLLMVRSNTEYGLSMLKRKVKGLVEFLGGVYTLENEYMPWEYAANSKLRDVMVDTYAEMYRAKPIVSSVHAGLECGIIGVKMPGLDMVSFGPDLKHVHTPDEELDIASTWRCYEYLINVLERL